MTTTFQIEHGSLAALAITGAVKAAIHPLWLAGAAVVALCGCVAVAVLCPVFPIAIGLIALFGGVTFPSKAVSA